VVVIAAAVTSLAAWLLVSPLREDRMRRIAEGDLGDALARLRHRLEESRYGPWARPRRERLLRREVQALVALVAELRAGQPPEAALIHAAGTPPAWPSAVAAALSGSNVAEALRRDAGDGSPAASLALCWHSTVVHGASLSDAVERIAAGARASQEARTSLAAELAGPRATARVLALLPVIGIALGTLMGGSPLAWLVGTRQGWLCLVAGVTLTVAGMWWTSRIATRVESLL
jgi:tight adherence protein B